MGNIEYKLKLVNPSSTRLEHLVTQVGLRKKWYCNNEIMNFGSSTFCNEKGKRGKLGQFVVNELRKGLGRRPAFMSVPQLCTTLSVFHFMEFHCSNNFGTRCLLGIQFFRLQMKWRLREGHGEALYNIGVEDNGVMTGLSDDDMSCSLDTLQVKCLPTRFRLWEIVSMREGLDGWYG